LGLLLRAVGIAAAVDLFVGADCISTTTAAALAALTDYLDNAIKRPRVPTAAGAHIAKGDLESLTKRERRHARAPNVAQLTGGM